MPKISKGDQVQVISGDNKGFQGEVQRVIRKKNKDGTYNPERTYVLVAGANLVIRHQRRTGRVNTQTGRIEKEAPIHISNVMLVGEDGKATRVRYEVSDEEKVRVNARTGEPLPKKH